jgi:non-specific serine/threonine protein kinase
VFRPFAAEKLQSRGESSAALARHARAYTALAERLETDYDLAPTASWYPRATVEIENFTAAPDWALENRHDVALGQRLAAALRPVWLTAGGGTHWRTLARELVDERTPALLAAQLDYNAAFAGYVSGEFDAALTISNRLSAVFLELGDPLRALYAQSLAAFILVFAGRLAEADPLIAAALDAARSFGRDVLVAFLLRAAAQASSLRGDSADCREKYAQALAIYEALGAERHINFMSVSLAEVEFAAGNAERAFALCATCLDRLRATDSPVALATALTNIAAYSIALDRWEHARAYAGEALTLAQATQDAQSIADAVQHLAAVAVLEPPAAAAPSTAERAAPAAQILGYVERYYAELGVVLDFTERLGFDRALRAVRAALAAAEVDRNMAEGAAMTAQQVISLASAL